MKGNTKVFTLSICFFLLLITLLSFKMGEGKTIKGYKTSISSYSITSLLSKNIGKRASLSLLTKVKRDLTSLSYLDSVKLTYKDGNLFLDGEVAKDNILLYDEERLYLYNGKFIELDSKDVTSLVGCNTLFRLSREELDSTLQERGFVSLYLKELLPYSHLIRSIDYSYNNSSIYGGSLYLTFSKINATLFVLDTKEVSFISKAIEYIESVSLEDESTREYEFILKNSRLEERGRL